MHGDAMVQMIAETKADDGIVVVEGKSVTISRQRGILYLCAQSDIVSSSLPFALVSVHDNDFPGNNLHLCSQWLVLKLSDAAKQACPCKSNRKKARYLLICGYNPSTPSHSIMPPIH